MEYNIKWKMSDLKMESQLVSITLKSFKIDLHGSGMLPKCTSSRIQGSNSQNKTNKHLDLKSCWNLPTLWCYKLCRYEQDLRSISSKDFQSAIILNLIISHLSQGSSKPPPNKKSPGSQGLTTHSSDIKHVGYFMAPLNCFATKSQSL